MATTNVVGRRVRLALQNAENEDFAEAMLHASIAVDITSKHEYPSERRVGLRYKRFLKNQINMNIITGVMGMPVADVLIPFSHPGIPTSVGKAVSIVDILYHAIRCAMAHDGALPENMTITKDNIIAPERSTSPLILPHTLIWGLIMAVVGAQVNSKESLGSGRDFRITFKNSIEWRVNSLWGKRSQMHHDILELRKMLGK